MADEEEKEETPEEEKENSGGSEEPEEEKSSEAKSTRTIEDANLAAKRLEEANKKTEELVRRQEALAVQTALGGRSEGGAPVPKKTVSDEAYAEAVMRGEVNPMKVSKDGS